MVQNKAIKMANFAFLKEIFYGLGDFFKFSFQALPPIGDVANIILSLVIFGLLVYWCIRIVGFGKDDKRAVDYRKPHNFID